MSTSEEWDANPDVNLQRCQHDMAPSPVRQSSSQGQGLIDAFKD